MADPPDLGPAGRPEPQQGVAADLLGLGGRPGAGRPRPDARQAPGQPLRPLGRQPPRGRGPGRWLRGHFGLERQLGPSGQRHRSGRGLLERRRQQPRRAHRRRHHRLRPRVDRGAVTDRDDPRAQHRSRVRPAPCLLSAADLSPTATNRAPARGHDRADAHRRHPTTGDPGGCATLPRPGREHTTRQHRRAARGQPHRVQRVPRRPPPRGDTAAAADPWPPGGVPHLQPSPTLAAAG